MDARDQKIHSLERELGFLYDELNNQYRLQIPKGWTWSTCFRRWTRTYPDAPAGHKVATVAFYGRWDKVGGVENQDGDYRWYWSSRGSQGYERTLLDAIEKAQLHQRV